MCNRLGLPCLLVWSMLTGPPGQALHFRHDDILLADWADADVVFITSTCFPLELMAKIEAPMTGEGEGPHG